MSRKIADDGTFEEVAGAKKLVAWFHARGFESDEMAPRVDGRETVETFTTEEGLSGYRCEWEEPPPSDRTIRLAAEIIDAPDVDKHGCILSQPSGLWWDATSFRAAEEEDYAEHVHELREKAGRNFWAVDNEGCGHDRDDIFIG